MRKRNIDRKKYRKGVREKDKQEERKSELKKESMRKKENSHNFKIDIFVQTWYSASLLERLDVLRPDLTADAIPTEIKFSLKKLSILKKSVQEVKLRVGWK